MYDEFLSVLIDGVKQIADYAVLGCAGITGVALTIFGLKWAVYNIKEFFYGIALANDEDYQAYIRDNGNKHYDIDG